MEGVMVLPVESGTEDCFGAEPVREEGIWAGVRAVSLQM
jgi:hypothetical protein